MCGVFGILPLGSEATPDKALLDVSARALHHRGPDAQSVYSAPGIGLAHTRLTFLDVDARANQPMWDESRRYVLVYNGEIYNYKELRQELEKTGAQFRTTSDTEVLLQALIIWGPRVALPRLNGMFGFGFYDTRSGSLVIARDRFGMKPMYYFQDGSQFLFASEIKAMQPWASFTPDKFSISSYLLTFGGPTKGFTFYEGLKSLSPGTYLTIDRKGMSETSDFFLLTEFLDQETMTSLSEARPAQVIDLVDETLSASVARHMFADVPVGAFCSGGVDSSLLMAMAAKQHDDLAIFHANVKGQWSEHHAAADLSKHLGLELKSVDVEEQDFVDLLPKVMAHYEHPYTYHPNCAPLMMVAQLARDNGVKGLLSGEGSDECFLGYPWLGRKRLMDRYHGLGRGLRQAVRKVPGVGPLIWPYDGNTHNIVRGLLNRREIEDDRAHNRQTVEAFDHKNNRDETLWTLDYLNHHLRTLLHRNDTMGMAASIEARFPFLDHAMVKLAVNMPAKYKLHHSPFVFEKAHPFMRDKWVVRKVADRYMPKGLSQRIKIGFWTTIFQRLTVSPRIFDGSFVTDLFEITSSQMDTVFEAGDQDLQMRLLHLDIWGRVCFGGDDPDVHVSRLREHTSIRPE